MTVTDEAAPVLVVRRQMAVPRERVFEAWLDSESLARWMRPGNFTHATVTVDPRVGGGAALPGNQIGSPRLRDGHRSPSFFSRYSSSDASRLFQNVR